MAATVSWREKLNFHPIAKHLRRKNTNDHPHKQPADAKSLICVYGSDLYAWDAAEGQILHCNLKTLLDDNRAESDHKRNDPSISDLATAKIQENDTQYQVRII